MTDETPTPDTQAEPAAAKKKRTWIFPLSVMLFPVVLFGGCMAILASGGSDGPTSSHAISACRDAVRTQLKDPDSAQFSDEDTRSTGDGWIVTGTVRADNSFGGPAVTTYTCTTNMEQVTDLRIAP